MQLPDPAGIVARSLLPLATLSLSSGLAALAAEEQQIRIAIVATPAAIGSAWSDIRAGAERAAAEQGVTVEFRDSGRALGAVEAIVGNLLEKPIAGVVIAISDLDAAAGPIRLAREAGLSVVTIGAGFEVARSLGAVLHVGQDDYESGRQAGVRLRDLGADAGICVMPETGEIRAELRCQGLRAGFGLPIETIALAGKPDDDARRAKSLVDGRGAGDFIAFADGGSLAAATARAAAESDRKLRVVAFDPEPGFLSLLAVGKAAFAVDSQPGLQGYQPVVLLANAARSGDLPVANVATGPRFIDQAEAARRVPPPPEPPAPEAQIAPEDGGPWPETE